MESLNLLKLNSGDTPGYTIFIRKKNCNTKYKPSLLGADARSLAPGEVVRVELVQLLALLRLVHLVGEAVAFAVLDGIHSQGEPDAAAEGPRLHGSDGHQLELPGGQ